MKEILNTVYVTKDRAYLHLEHDTLRMEVKSETLCRMPLLHLGSIVCFGDILLSPALLHRCAEDGRSIVLLDQAGRFKARIEGPVHGNVLLRQAQYKAHANASCTLAIARNMVAGKVQNSRQVLLRAGRETPNPADKERLTAAAAAHAQILTQIAQQETIDAAASASRGR